MIKKDIVRLLHENHGGMTLDEADEYTGALLDLLKEAVLRSDVTITGFGRFRHKQGIVREVVMPDGSRCLTSAEQRIRFLPSAKLKAHLNAGREEGP